jgi:hypothetical protein
VIFAVHDDDGEEANNPGEDIEDGQVLAQQLTVKLDSNDSELFQV